MLILQNTTDGSTGQFLILSWMILLTDLLVAYPPLTRSHSRKQRDWSTEHPAFLMMHQLVAAKTAAFFRMLTRPDTQARLSKLMSRSLQQRGDFELRLGQYLGIE
jgi:hypothetical protein